MLRKQNNDKFAWLSKDIERCSIVNTRHGGVVFLSLTFQSTHGNASFFDIVIVIVKDKRGGTQCVWAMPN